MNQIITKIKNTPLTEPNFPWEKVGAWAISGMRSIGFSECSRYILVETTDGRGLFDSQTGEKISRDNNEYKDQELQLLCKGIGPIEGELVRMSGLSGGGLLNVTSDMWQIEIVAESWPKYQILLVEPDSSLFGAKYNKPDQFLKIWDGYELRGAGFSYNGNTLCIGESSDLVIYNRKVS